MTGQLVGLDTPEPRHTRLRANPASQGGLYPQPPGRPWPTCPQPGQAPRPSGLSCRPPVGPRDTLLPTQPEAGGGIAHPAGDRLERKGQLRPGL